MMSSAAECKTPEYMAKFPTGKAPGFDAKEGPLFESSAVAYYVAAHDEKLIGKSPFEKASIMQWISFADSEFYPVLCAWMYPLLGYAPYDKAAHDKLPEAIYKVLAILEKVFSTKKFLVGQDITLADIVMASCLVPAFTMLLDGPARAQFPNLTRWFQGCISQDNFKAVLGELPLCQATMQYAAPK